MIVVDENDPVGGAYTLNVFQILKMKIIILSAKKKKIKTKNKNQSVDTTF